MKKLQTGKYQHYKGTFVEVISEALHSETKEPLVVYKHLEDGQMWVRPLKMFLETVTVNGKEVPRFKKLVD